MPSEIFTIGEWYRENREVIDKWLDKQKLGTFYALPIEAKRKIYDHINNTKTV